MLMLACALRQDNEAQDDERPDDRRSERAAQGQSTVSDRLVKKLLMVAPSGRVRMNAAQNRKTGETLLQK